MPHHDQLGAAVRQPYRIFSLSLTRVKAQTVICPRRGMHSQQSFAVGEFQTPFQRQRCQPIEPASRSDRALCPGKAARDHGILRQQMQVSAHLFRRRTGQLAGNQIPVGIAVDKVRIGQTGQALQRHQRFRTNSRQIAKDPKLIYRTLQLNIRKNGLEGDRIAVNIS